MANSLTILISFGDYSVVAFLAPFGKPKERQRFYLLPGMGGRNLRRKRKVIMRWSIAAGLLTSALLAGLLYWLSRR